MKGCHRPHRWCLKRRSHTRAAQEDRPGVALAGSTSAACGSWVSPASGFIQEITSSCRRVSPCGGGVVGVWVCGSGVEEPCPHHGNWATKKSGGASGSGGQDEYNTVSPTQYEYRGNSGLLSSQRHAPPGGHFQLPQTPQDRLDPPIFAHIFPA